MTHSFKFDCRHAQKPGKAREAYRVSQIHPGYHILLFNTYLIVIGDYAADMMDGGRATITVMRDLDADAHCDTSNSLVYPYIDNEICHDSAVSTFLTHAGTGADGIILLDNTGVFFSHA